MGSTIHLSKSPTFHPENEERRNFQEVIQDTISQGSFSRQLNVQHTKGSSKIGKCFLVKAKQISFLQNFLKSLSTNLHYESPRLGDGM